MRRRRSSSRSVEDDLKFVVDVTAPLSTGLFADLREGRRAVRQWASGQRVLNLFSYTGAISVYAQAGGATEVCAIDVAAKAHARARRNFTASGFDPEKPEHIVGDVFKVLARFLERRRTFDMVVVDPPAFASAAARGGKPWSAMRDYSELITAALDVLAPGGLLAAASSTHKMTSEEFERSIADGAMAAGTRLQILDRRRLPSDFPTVPGFPEASYLKFIVALGSGTGLDRHCAVRGNAGRLVGDRFERVDLGSASLRGPSRARVRRAERRARLRDRRQRDRRIDETLGDHSTIRRPRVRAASRPLECPCERGGQVGIERRAPPGRAASR